MNEIADILKQSKTVAVVGLSPNPDRMSYVVAHYLKQQGYHIIPVNPTAQEVLGEKCYPDLKAIGDNIDVVDIFRRPEDVEPIVDAAIAVGAKAVWMQLGIVNEKAAEKARKAGLQVVMDRCMKVEHMRLAMERT